MNGRKIAVFYHAVLSGPLIPSPDLALAIFSEQMAALKTSGLAAAAEIHIGINDADQLLAMSLAPDGAYYHSTGDGTGGEWPTLQALREWVPLHADWAVCYHHMKGVSHGADVYANWRRCLQKHVIFDWQKCLQMLGRGFDTVGAHWHTHLDQRYWAGNFWWATPPYLARLPDIPAKTVAGKSYEGEVWIGKSPRAPRYCARAHHQVMSGC